MCFNQDQREDIPALNGASLKLVDRFFYLGSSVSSTEDDISMRLTKVWTAIARLSVIWKPDLSDKIKCVFFQTVIVSILLCGCTTWTLGKRYEKKKLDSNCSRMVRTILKKILEATSHKTAAVRPPTSNHQTIQKRWTRHAGQ